MDHREEVASVLEACGIVLLSFHQAQAMALLGTEERRNRFNPRWQAARAIPQHSITRLRHRLRSIA